MDLCGTGGGASQRSTKGSGIRGHCCSPGGSLDATLRVEGYKEEGERMGRCGSEELVTDTHRTGIWETGTRPLLGQERTERNRKVSQWSDGTSVVQ